MGAASSRLAPATLDRLAAGVAPGWLSRQRWYASKGRTIRSIRLADAVALPAAPGEAETALLLVQVTHADGEAETYQLPVVLVARDAEADTGEVLSRDAATGAAIRPPRDGDGLWRSVASLVRAGADLPARRGSFAFRAASPTALDGDGQAIERTLSGEQSNTSVVLDDRIFMKCYRRPEPGPNPDVEVAEFLLTQTSFRATPALLGTVRYRPERGEASALAILQAFVPGARDAWEWLLQLLAAGGGGADADGSGADDEPEAAVREIGAVIASLHVALASAPGEAFPLREATESERLAWHVSGELQLQRAEEALRGTERLELLSLRTDVAAALAPLADPSFAARMTRIHGDLHLGQVLPVGGGFVVIDFEGEPARPLAERRRPQSPLKDVAGMLRSLDYAGRTAAARRGGGSVTQAVEIEAWWRRSREALVSAYDFGLTEPTSSRPEAALLRAFEVEKACYEIAYEARNRPDWIWLPLAGLRRLVTGDG